MNEKIINKQTAKHYLWGDNCDSWVFADTEALSIKQESMPAGTCEKLHFHTEAQQFFFMLKGTATFYIDDNKIVVAEKEGVLIEAGSRHYISNETPDRIEFLVISQPSTNKDRITIEQE